MPATVIAERVGWDRSMSVFTARVRELRPFYRAAGPVLADRRISRVSGCSAICGSHRPTSRWGMGRSDSPPVLVMTAGYSRVLDAVMIPTRTAEDLIAGHWQLLHRFGAVPRELVWDQEGAVGPWRPRQAGAHRGVRGVPRHAGHLGAVCVGLAARRPRAWSSGTTATTRRRSCPGGCSPPRRDFNAQIAEWITARANVRHHRALGCQPIAPVGDGQGRDAAAAAGRPGTGLAALGAPAPGPLRAHRHQRLLGRPAGDRPTRRGGR